jgi:hypothetical protein
MTMGKTLNEARIHSKKPKWADMPETSRSAMMVTFKSPTGKIIVSIAAVEAYRKTLNK